MSFAFSRRKWTNLFRSSSRKQRRAAAAKPSLQMLHLEDRVTPAQVTISGGESSSWIISDTGTTDNGLPSGGTGTNGAAGTGATIGDASIPGQGDAFDFGGMVWVNDVQVKGALTQTGNQVDFAPSTIAGLNVAMHYFIASTSSTARVFVSLSNPTGSPIMVPVDYATNFGSDGATTIQASSNGNTSFEVTDRWLVTDDTTVGNDPANTTVLFGPGTPAVTPSNVSTTVFDLAGTQGALARYTITIGAGQTRSLMWFQQLNPTTATAIADAAAFFDVNPTFGSDLLGGLSPTQVLSVANFSLNADTLSADLVGTTLTIADLANNNNSFTVSVSGSDLVITDTTGTFPGGSSTYTIALASVSNLVINGSGGSDTLRTIGSIPVAIEFNGGTGTSDALRVSGTGLNATYTPSQTTFGSGTVAITGGQTITFTGLEPVDMDFVGGTVTVDTGAGTADLLTVENSFHTFDGTTPALKISGTANATPIEAAYVSGAAVVILTNDGTDSVTVTSADNAHGNTSLNINAGTDTGDAITIDGTTTVSGTTTLNAPTINLNANVTNAVTGTTATVVNVASPGQIQDGVNVAASGATVNVAAGTYTENVVLNKPLMLLGAQAGVDARGRVVGAPSPAVESIIAPAAGIAFDLQTGSNNAKIDGVAFVGSLNGATGVVGNSSGTNDNLQFVNNYVAVATGFTAAAIFMNRPAIEATFDKNEIVAATGSTQAVFFDGPDAFHGLYFTNNNVLRSGALAGTGLFVDGARNIGNTGGVRDPLVQGNLFQNHALGFNAGQRSFANTMFVDNTFTLNTGGFAGGPLNSSIARNTFSNNSLYGIRLTAFGNTSDPTRGAQNTTVSNNFFSGNGTTVDLVNGYGDIRIDDQFNGTQSTNTIVENSLSGPSFIFNRETNAETIKASNNTFGTSTLSTISAGILGVAAANVDYTPYLTNSTDTSAAAGFQGDFTDLTVHAAGAQSGMTGRITEGYNALDDSPMAGGILRVIAGTYTDNIDLTAMGDKKVTLAPGSSPGQVTVNGNVLLSANDTLAIEIGGLNAATDYDNLIVNGTVTLGGATLSVQQFGIYTIGTMAAESYTIIDNDGSDLVTGEFAGLPEGSKISYAGGNLYITYQGGDGNDVVLNNYPVINGTAAGDTVTITPTATGYDYQLNMDPVVSVVGTLPFVFNGLGGDDTMTVNLNAFNIPSIVYDGGTQTAPIVGAGNNLFFGDVLVVNDQNGTHTATYTGDGTLPMSGGFAGTVAVMGENTITFTGLEPVDMIGLAVVNIAFANDDDVVTIAEGLDSATGTLPALVVSGTSGGVGFEQVHLRNNTQVNIDTTDVDGDDTVTITGAANAHGNANIAINSGTGSDLVTVTGAASFSGNVAVTTVDFSTNGGNLTAGGNVSATLSGDLTANNAIAATGTVMVSSSSATGATIAVNAAVSGSAISISTVLGADTVSVASTGSLTANAGNVSISTGASADMVSIGGSVSGTIIMIQSGGANDTIEVSSTGSIAGTGIVFVNGNNGEDTITISGPVTSTIDASIRGGNDNDSITINTSGATTLNVDGEAGDDSMTVNVGTLVGTVAVSDISGTDTLTVNGTAVANTFEVNTATGGSATVAVDTTQVVTYTNTIETLSLDGGDLGDTFNIFFAQGMGSFLPATVNIADTGATGTDVANVSGTDNADTIDVNFTATRTTTLGGESVRYVNGNLETLNVFSKAGNDLVFAKAVLNTGGPVVNLNGGSPSNPTPLPGDILVLDVTGMMGLSTANIKTPAGSVTSTSHNDLTWADFETIPTPIGLGGTFDFGTASSPVQAGPYVVPAPGKYWVGVANTDTYASKGYYGWTTPVNSTDRGAASPNPMLTTFHNVLRDSNWFGPLNVTGTFNVAAVAAGNYQVSVTIGDTAVVMDSIFVTIEGLADPIAVQKGLQGQFSTVTGIGSDANVDGKIAITIVDKAGTHSYWHVNAIDVRPVGLVSPVTITPVGGVGTKVADGLSTTSYTASGFFPNAIVTVSTTGGTITSADVDPFLLGVQVKASPAGVASFDLQHPTGNADVTLTANAAIVVDAKGTFTQSFTLTPSQKIDFNAATSPTEPGYLGVSNALYAGTASNGLGWQGPVSLGDRGAASGTALFRDFVFNLQGAANAGTFVIDLPTGAPHVVTVYLGDPATARDRMQIEVADSAGTFAAVPLATEIRSLKTNSLSFTVTPYANGGTFQTRLRFSDLGGTQNGWSVQGIEYRTLASQGVLGVTPVAPVMGNGTAVTNYVITGGAVGGLVTLSSQFGAIQGMDASTLYDGFQVQLDMTGGGSFAIQSPVVAAGTLASAVGLVAVNGSHAATFTQQYTGAQVKYDFGSSVPANVATGFTYLSGSQIATAQNGVGFKAVAGEYDRNPTSYPNVSKTTDPALFRDAVSGTGSGTFRVLVGAGATNVPVKVYSYDAYSSRGPITVTPEGGTKQTLTPSMTTPAVYNVVGNDLNGDGFLDITIAGNAVWMMNGIEVG